jgi:uncharacterized protein YcbX
MVVDPAGKCLTQRDIPGMAAVRVGFVDGGLCLSADGADDLFVPFQTESAAGRNVTVWQSRCLAIGCGDGPDRWLTEVLGRTCGLVRMTHYTRREIEIGFNRGDETVSFADGFPLLVTVEASLANLNERLGSGIPMSRFRPNLVVSDAEPFAEDRWGVIRIGGSTFRAAKPCARCSVTTIDQDLGITTGKEPLKTLAAYRSARQVFGARYPRFGLDKNSILFGLNLVPNEIGSELNVGDQVEVLEMLG